MNGAIEEMDIVVVKCIKSVQRWYGHVIRMNEGDFVARAYEGRIDGV